MTDKLNKNEMNMDIYRSRGTEKTHTKFTAFLMEHGADHTRASSAGLRMGWNHIPSHFCARTRKLWGDL
jgi:hypothetical protein